MLLSILTLLALAHATFLFAIWRKDNGLADIFWGMGFITLSLTLFWQTGSFLPRQILAHIMVVLWGLRLALHITARNWGRGEDKRYLSWRKEWGKNWLWRSYLQVFVLQSALLCVVAAPIFIIQGQPNQPALNLIDCVGFGIWLFGLSFEAVGDFQLLQFKQRKHKPGAIMTQGLWKYTRHPNYFGEVTLWWGFWLLVVGLPGGWFSAIGPATLTFLILFVSGVPLLEKRQMKNPAFRKYAQKTSVFLPWWPKKA